MLQIPVTIAFAVDVSSGSHWLLVRLRARCPVCDQRISVSNSRTVSEFGTWYPFRELDFKYRYEIVKDFHLSFSGWFSFDNEAPVAPDETVKQDDYGLVTSLGWES